MKHTELQSALQASPHRRALIKHRFFDDFSRSLSREQVAVVLGQWWHPLHYFPEFLARLLAVVPTLEMKTAVSRILHEELGEGTSDQAHERVYVTTMTDVGFTADAVAGAAMLPGTDALLAGYRSSTRDAATGLGFLYGTEVADLAMVGGIGRAVRRTTGVNRLPWVDIHVAQEPGHVTSANEALSYTDEEASRIVGGAETMWQLWVGFFDGLMHTLRSDAASARAERRPAPGHDAGPAPGGPGVRHGVLAAIGKTPLVALARYLPGARFDLYGKLEAVNPGGSIKDRPARYILETALERGEIDRRSVIVEATSGNMGIGLAQVCRYLGLRCICVVDTKTTAQNVTLLRAYGAEVDVIDQPDPETGEFLPARLARVKQLLASDPHAFWPNQYANPQNPAAHHETMREIVDSLGASPDYLFCATSTCGTLRGCAEYVAAHDLDTTIIAVDAVGSAIFGGPKARRLIPGHGAGLRPALFQPDLAERCIHVTDLDCVVACRRLARREAIVAGGSSGAVLAAIERVRDELREGSTCVAILPDRGERYLDTIFHDEWVAAQFGNVAQLWADA